MSVGTEAVDLYTSGVYTVAPIPAGATASTPVTSGDTVTVYVSVGNSDDKLTQQRWAWLVGDISDTIQAYAVDVHGEWFSPPASRFQNACWCFTLPPVTVGLLRRLLAEAAARYGQDAITWAQVPAVEFITPSRPVTAVA